MEVRGWQNVPLKPLVTPPAGRQSLSTRRDGVGRRLDVGPGGKRHGRPPRREQITRVSFSPDNVHRHCCIGRADLLKGDSGDETAPIPLPRPIPPFGLRRLPVPARGHRLSVRWYLRFGLSYRAVEELLAERGVKVDHVTVYRWVQRFALEFAEAARARQHVVGDRWHGGSSPERSLEPGSRLSRSPPTGTGSIPTSSTSCCRRPCMTHRSMPTTP